MDDTDRYHVEHLIQESILAHEKRAKRSTLHDDYEKDSVELWGAIEKLQKRIEELEMNGEPQERERT